MEIIVEQLTKEEMESIAFDMYYEDHYPYKAIAEFLNCSERYAKSLVSQAFIRETKGGWTIKGKLYGGN